MIKKLLLTTLALLATSATIYSTPLVEVFAKDEGINDAGMSKPRIYVKNVGDESISNFSYKYTFTSETGKTPLIKDFHTPFCSISLESNGGDNYSIVYDYTGVTLKPGEVTPHTSGNAVGIHYADWSAYDYTNDVSNNSSEIFAITTDIIIFDENGGTIPENSTAIPVADAGNDQTSNIIDATITLDGSASYDIDGTIKEYKWTITTPSNGNFFILGEVISFQADEYGTYIIELAVKDNDGSVVTDDLLVTILDETQTTSNYDLEVYTKMIGTNESNITKPRMYIKNIGESTISDFKVRYYFTEENGTPVGEFWHDPSSVGSIVDLGENNYYVEFDHTGYALLSNEVTPHLDGNSFGIHLANWSEIEKLDDHSYIESSDFEINDNVVIFDKEGNHVYGTLPDYAQTYPHKYNLAATTPFTDKLQLTWDPIADEDYLETVLRVYLPDGTIEVYQFATNYKDANFLVNPNTTGTGRLFYAELYIRDVLVDRVEAYQTPQ